MITDHNLVYQKIRMDLYRLLADCYYSPTHELIGKLGELRPSLERIYPDVSQNVSAMERELRSMDDLYPLEIDFAKLFVGPFSLLAPPYGSVHLEGGRQVMGESTLNVRDHYREAGLDISEDFRNPPDHIAVELEFMHFVVSREIDRILNSDREKAMNYHNQQEKFLRQHLGVWGSEFADLVFENARTLFYKNLAKATKLFLETEPGPKLSEPTRM